MRLAAFKILSFDCYGTLIDWETGIFQALTPILQRHRQAPPREAVLESFARHESAQQAETPHLPYRDLLARVHRRLAAQWGIAASEAEHGAFAASIADWPAFPDSAPALQYLKQFYKLVILSNVDRTGFANSNAKLGVAFDAIYTAEDIGSYKPDLANFRYMLAALEREGFAPGDILHVAQSLFHDHAPANALGLASAWIDRRHGAAGWGATAAPPERVRYDFHFTSLAELADAHRREPVGPHAFPTGGN